MIMIDWKKNNNKKQLDIGILQLKVDVYCIFFLLVVNWLLDKKIKSVD